MKCPKCGMRMEVVETHPGQQPAYNEDILLFDFYCEDCEGFIRREFKRLRKKE